MAELRLLVVEDNPADAHRVREALEKRGRGRFRATFAGALRDAERLLPDSDIVLLDLSLPDSHGADTVARVRARAPGTPVVVLSGERDEEMAFRCLQHGAQDVLLKGAIDADALVRALSCALERQALAKERDAALLRSRSDRAEFEGILEAVGEGILVTDSSGRALYANPAAELLLGWPAGSATGKSVDPAMATDGEVAGDRVRVDGSPSMLEVRTAPVRWQGSVAILAAIHEAPRPDAGRARRRGAGGTREGEERLEATRRFAGGIARGMGEHLAVVLEGAFDLSDGGDAAAFGPALKIQRAAWSASALVGLLRACAGESKAVPEDIDLNELLDSGWERLVDRAPDGVTFARSPAPGLPRVRADRRLLAQALTVLVDHARAVVADGGTVTVGTALLVPDRSTDSPDARPSRPRVALTVTDSGPWLDAESCRRLFEPFYSTEVLGAGTGLGLAPAAGIALQCGGAAQVESLPGKGTTVRILLPAVGDDAGGDPAALHVPESDAGSRTTGPATILVAEDDPWMRWRIFSILEGLGYRVLSAACPADAVRLAATFRGPVQLLLAESSGPGMDGESLAGILRERRPGLRVLLLNDGALEGGSVPSLEGECRTLPSPFHRDELADAVRALLDLPVTGTVSLDAPLTAPRSPS